MLIVIGHLADHCVARVLDGNANSYLSNDPGRRLPVAPGGLSSTHPDLHSAGLLADPLVQIQMLRPVNRVRRRNRRSPIAARPRRDR